MEDYKGTFTKDEIEEMFLKITDKVCENCEKKEWCLGENRVHTYQMLYEILCAVEEYGAELNIELKRKLQKKCIMAPRFLRETLEVFENAKQILMWNNKIVQNLSLIHILIEDEEMISDKCIWCGKPAKHMAYWGKSY